MCPKDNNSIFYVYYSKQCYSYFKNVWRGIILVMEILLCLIPLMKPNLHFSFEARFEFIRVKRFGDPEFCSWYRGAWAPAGAAVFAGRRDYHD